MIGSVGPNVSSRMIFIEWSTSTSTVGSKKRPSPSRRWPPTRTLAPLATASRTCSSTISICGGNVTAPTSTEAMPAGAPWRSLRTLSDTFCTNSS